SSRRRHTRFSRDWSSDVCSSDLIGHGHTAAMAADHLAGVFHMVLVQAQTTDQALIVPARPAQLGKHPDLAETGIPDPGLLAEGILHAHAAACAVTVALGVRAYQQFQIVPDPGDTEPCTQGSTVDVGRHAPGHHAGGRWCAQTVVVHHMVRMVVVDPGFKLTQAATAELPLKTQAEAFPLELGAVHAPAGVTGLAVPRADTQLQQGVVVRRPAHGQIGIPLVPARGHTITVTVPVVTRAGAVTAQPQIAVAAAEGAVQLQVATGIGAAHQRRIQPAARLVETFRQTLEQHGARRGARPPGYGLRALDHGEL